MATRVIMPKLGLTMVEGKIVEWRKKEGDSVQKGEVLYVMETEKTTYEIESPATGILAKIIGKVDDIIPAGETVAYILQPGEKADEVLTRTNEPKAGESQRPPGKEVLAFAQPNVGKLEVTKKVRATPLARKIAKQQNLDLSTVNGTGPGKRILRKDVLKTLQDAKTPVPVSPSELPRKDVIVPLTTMRKTIARRMSQSFQTSPHFWVVDEVDVTELKKILMILLPTVEKRTGKRLTYTDVLLKLVSGALSEYSYMNATWTEDGIKLLGEINIGIAVDVPNGLVVPVLRGVTTKSLSEIVAQRSDLVTRAREGKLTLNEMTGGTFTLNNVGALGVLYLNAIINPPECGILTVGGIVEKPVVVGGEIAVRPVLTLSLGCDHRVVDGAYAARFLATVKSLIEQPSLILV